MRGIEGLRAGAHQFSIASALTSYPDDDVLGLVKPLLSASSEGALGRVGEGLAQQRGDDLRAAYVELFDRGGGRASLYETEYGRMRGMGKGTDLADIAGFYNAFGLSVDTENVHEVVDHISVELEFYAVLLLKEAALCEGADEEGVFVVHDARKKFLADHLGRFTNAIADVESVRAHAVYGDVFGWVKELVRRECEVLEVTPAALDFFSDDERKEEMKCGSVHLPVLS